MKEIKAIIQPFLLSKGVEALKEIQGLPGVIVSEVRAYGRTGAVGSANTVLDEGIEYEKKMKLEIVAPNQLVEPILRVITERTHRECRGREGVCLLSRRGGENPVRRARRKSNLKRSHGPFRFQTIESDF